MSVLLLDDCVLFYETAGSGPPLLFAHGLGGNHLSWWAQVPHFRGRFTCITYAQRGFWPSTGTPDPARNADDLAALLDHLGVADVCLVAQSMGGWTVMDYAVRHPERVRAIIFAATPGSLDHPELRRIQSTHAAASPVGSLWERGIHPAAGERMAREQPALHYLYREIDALSVGLDKEALRTALARHRPTSPAMLAALTMPVLCISGEEDVVVPPAAVALLASLLPDARLEHIPAAGHSVYFERAETFNRLLASFLPD
jgi:pimeloyl-ACP methyl ester carboxylesterase